MSKRIVYGIVIIAILIALPLLWQLARSAAPAEPGVTVRDRLPSDPPAARPPTRREIIVHVAGAVMRPGVYWVVEGSRVNDAIRAAGGTTPDADVNALNLAANLNDADKVLVPTRAPVPAAMPLSQPPPPPASIPSANIPPLASMPPVSPQADRPAKLTVPGQGAVNINTADAVELQRLPGVGVAMAERILAHRAQHGAFTTPEQLMDVRGIGPRTYEKLRPFLAL